MSIKINVHVDNKLKRGDNKGLVSISLTSDKNGLEYDTIRYLDGKFKELPDGVTCVSTCWGPMHKGWSGYVEFAHRTKYKKDHVSGEQILGFLVTTYGDLEAYIRKCINELVKKLKLVERAKACMREADHVGGAFSNEAYKKAAIKINYAERLAALKAELRSAISDEYDKLIDREDWTYQGGEKIDPVSVQLILSKADHFKDRAMPSRFPHSVGQLFNEYHAPWLAAAIEGNKDNQ